MRLSSTYKLWIGDKIGQLQKAGPPSLYALYKKTEGLLHPPMAEAFRYLWASLPFSDYVNENTPEILVDYVNHGLMLYENSPFVKNVPIEIFMEYVLQPRVNNEPLEPCRPYLYSLLKERAKGKTTLEGVVEVNYWCCEEVSYMASDERTAPALSVMRAAKGRCGEESCFTVQALRSVGIPARQVYAPLWAHSDDNHAWVEAWVDGHWQFLGACEPEEALNRGWFTQSAARAMLVHSRSFGPLPPGEELADYFGTASQSNQLRRYAKSKTLTVTVINQGQPVKGAQVNFELLNYAQLWPIAQVITDAQGKAALTCGLGSLYVSCFFEGSTAQTIVDPLKEECLLRLHPQKGEEPWEDFTTLAPVVDIRPEEPLSPKALQKGQNKLAAANAKREGKIAEFYQKNEALPLLKQSKRPEILEKILHQSRGNMAEIIAFLKVPLHLKDFTQEEVFALKEDLLLTLSDKDLYDATSPLLLGHPKGAAVYAKAYEKQVFIQGILSPRIGLEALTPWREELPILLGEDKSNLQKNPQLIWAYVKQHTREEAALSYPTLITTPLHCLTSGVGSPLSQQVLFVALCRSLGIAAKLREQDGAPLYWHKGAYVPAKKEDEQGATLTLTGDDNPWRYQDNWTLAKFEKGQYRTLTLQHLPFDPRGTKINLVPGQYRIICRNRLPNGNQLAGKGVFTLQRGQNRTMALTLRKAETGELLQQIELPSFTLQKQGQPFTPKGAAMYFWLHPTREPTEHVLNELQTMAEDFRPFAKKMIFILPKEGLKDPLVKKVLSALGPVQLMEDEGRQAGRLLARRMFQDPDTLPFVLMTNSRGQGSYALCGYNVGTAQMLSKLWKIN